MRCVVSFLILILCVGLFFGCGNAEASPTELLEVRMARVSPLPDGEVYHFAVGKNGGAPLSSAQIASLYGEDAEATCFSKIEAYAVYLSSGLPCEIAVLRCCTVGDTETVAQMCLRRSELLRRILGHSALHERVSDIRITVEGRTVIMTVAA